MQPLLDQRRFQLRQMTEEDITQVVRRRNSLRDYDARSRYEGRAGLILAALQGAQGEEYPLRPSRRAAQVAAGMRPRQLQLRPTRLDALSAILRYRMRWIWAITVEGAPRLDPAAGLGSVDAYWAQASPYQGQGDRRTAMARCLDNLMDIAHLRRQYLQRLQFQHPGSVVSLPGRDWNIPDQVDLSPQLEATRRQALAILVRAQQHPQSSSRDLLQNRQTFLQDDTIFAPEIRRLSLQAAARNPPWNLINHPCTGVRRFGLCSYLCGLLFPVRFY